MKITKVNIPKSVDYGLGEIIMDRLGHVVLLAGKNGSGKTRILTKVFETLTKKPLASNVTKCEDGITQLEAHLLNLEIEIRETEDNLQSATKDEEIESLNHSLINQNKRITSYKQQIQAHEQITKWDLVETSTVEEKYTAVEFVPKHLVLKDSSTLSPHQLITQANRVDTIGVANLPAGSFAKIQQVQNRWFNTTHPDSNASEEVIASATREYNMLKDLIDIFLNTSVGRTTDGEATLFGFTLGQSKLSDGQKVLLQFCLAIYSQETALNDLILILDEPENHLHPSVIIETLERLAKAAPNGQIWIATHSIPILAHFDPSFIWYVENGKISYAGRAPEKVLRSLVGDSNEVAKLREFISLPAQFATSRYAFECLIEPGVADSQPSDPQSQQLRKELVEISKSGKLRILDFGAGKGRLLSNIFNLDEILQEKLISDLDYIAYDKESRYSDECIRTIERIYGNSEKRYYNDINALLSDYDKASFNAVIMCNVMHEIDPNDWLKIFSEDGSISQLLDDEGLLLLLEDHRMPVGEKAYQKGFLVLDTSQLKDLFKIGENDTKFLYKDLDGEGRLKLHEIPKRCLVRIDEQSRKNAIASLRFLARDRIIEVRELEHDYKNGLIHGFWVQQFANAELNLSEMTTLNSK